MQATVFWISIKDSSQRHVNAVEWPKPKSVINQLTILLGLCQIAAPLTSMLGGSENGTWIGDASVRNNDVGIKVGVGKVEIDKDLWISFLISELNPSMHFES